MTSKNTTKKPKSKKAVKSGQFQVKIKVSSCVSCKQCVHLSKEKLNGGKVCSDMGVIESSKVCGNYKPDVQVLRKSDGSEAIDLFQAIRSLPSEMLPIIASLLSREERTRRYTDFKVLQPVYVMFDGSGDYITDYCKAYILDADKEHVRVINKNGTFVAHFERESTSILTIAEFKARRAELLASNKIKNPKVDRSRVVVDETVPTIDQVVDEVKAKVTVSSKTDLSELFRQFQR
jgi:hypothetical protein